MPIINPSLLPSSGLHNVLRSAAKKSKKLDKEEIEALLFESDLGPSDAFRAVGEILRTGESDQSRLKAAEIALKLNGLMTQDNIITPPSVTIVINDSEHTSVNPILIPRTFNNHDNSSD